MHSHPSAGTRAFELGVLAELVQGHGGDVVKALHSLQAAEAVCLVKAREAEADGLGGTGRALRAAAELLRRREALLVETYA